MRSQVRALAEAGKVTECQRNCQSSGETASRGANLVIEVPRGWGRSDVKVQEIAWGSTGNSAMGRKRFGKAVARAKSWIQQLWKSAAVVGRETLGIEAEYHAVYQMTRYRLKAKLKVARPQNCQQVSEQRETFKQTSKATSTCCASTTAKDGKLNALFATLPRMRAALDCIPSSDD